MTKLNSVSESNTLHSVREFVQSAKVPYGLTDGQCKGFEVYMKEHDFYFMESEKEFIPYLKLYLGK